MTSGQDPFRYFRVEAREILEEVGRGVLQLEREPDAALAARLLRLAHTLKGAARVVKQAAIAERAHAMEEALAPLRSEGAVLGRDAVQDVLALLDAIAADVKALDLPRPRDSGGVEPARTVRADVVEMDSLLEGLSETSIQVRALRRTSDALAAARRLSELLVDQAAAGRLRSLAQDLRASIARIEQELASGLDLVERELADLHGAADRLRLVPAGSIFAGLERVAYDAAQATDRRVAFAARGAEIRLDAHVLGSVQNALVQLVRNAVAHGIEPAEARTRAGKTPTGRVEITVTRRGNRLAFACADDGRGFDVEGVRRAASNRGLATGAAGTMSDREMVDLLFRGGLTTSGEVTEVAGRGVGLDVVREAANAIGAEIRVETSPGRGARVELLVPISLSSIDALLVQSGPTIAAIPLEAVRSTMRVSETDVAHTATGENVVREGKVVALASLGRWLGGSKPATRLRSFAPAVVIEGAGGLAAIRVDRLIGTSSIVVRSLPRAAQADPMVVGAAFDAEGTPQLVLDPESLAAAALHGQAPDPAREDQKRLPILVIDDSLTTRRLEQSILESAGYEVDVATSAEEGLAKGRAKRYALFLVDVEMPGMDGFGFVAETRKDALLREVPSIMVTSRSAPEDRKRAEQVGARGFIAKSEFDQGELLDMIRRLRS